MGKKKKSNTQQYWNKYLAWLDSHILIILSGVLLAFIPLYPKLPLFDIIPGYIVRVRIEDLLVLMTTIVWCVQLMRKKVTWKTPLTIVVFLYAITGFLSILSAVFITQTVPLDVWHISKTVLHYIRYLEYFSLFFILYSAVNTTREASLLLKVILLTLLGVAVYGIGQRYLYWPVYSTMNREFSKGIKLVLDENARVQSTFGGHYDLGGYLVILLPLLLGTFYTATQKKIKLTLGTLFILGTWLLVISASRSSFAAYLLATFFTTLLYSLLQSTKLKSFFWLTTRYSALLIVTAVVSIYFGQNIQERLLQTIEGYPVINSNFHAVNGLRKEILYEKIPLALGIKEEKQQKFKVKIKKPKNAITTSEAEVLIASDTQPRPADVYVDVPAPTRIATVSATGEQTTIVVQQKRTYSDNALKHGLSLAIRLDTLWPRAIEGFKKNPLLGSGYATLTKETNTQFTEAESTDNNFLRTLGETGILGFVTFYGAIAIAIKVIYTTPKKRIKKHPMLLLYGVGFVSATIGLLLNAVYIDVFAASKIAFTYWSLAGITTALFTKLPHHNKENDTTSKNTYG